MNMLKAAYINELYKISKKKKLTVAAILNLSVVILAGISLNGLNLLGLSMASGQDFPLFMLSLSIYTLIPLFTAFICIDMFCGEFNNETIKITLTRPVSRLKVFTAKCMAAATFILSNLLFLLVLSTIMSFFVGIDTAFSLDPLISYIVSFFPLFTFSLMVILIANFIKGSAGAFMLTIVIFLLLSGVGIAFPTIGNLFFTHAFPWYTWFLGQYFNVAKVFRILLILLGYMTTFFSAGYILFDRKNF